MAVRKTFTDVEIDLLSMYLQLVELFSIDNDRAR